jgi:hypothetical protein
MPKVHVKELRDLAEHARKVAEQVRQDWGSAAPGGGIQVRVNRDMPSHGPDPDLQNVERALGNVVAAIEAYLRSRIPT